MGVFLHSVLSERVLWPLIVFFITLPFIPFSLLLLVFGWMICLPPLSQWFERLRQFLRGVHHSYQCEKKGPVFLLLILQLPISLVELCCYYGGLAFFTFGRGGFTQIPFFTPKRQSLKPSLSRQDRHARVQLYSLCLIFQLWNQKHYRSGTFVEDMKKNLRNVAIPGTGVPLSAFARVGRLSTLVLVTIFVPFICLLSSIHIGLRGDSQKEEEEKEKRRSNRYYRSSSPRGDDHQPIPKVIGKEKQRRYSSPFSSNIALIAARWNLSLIGSLHKMACDFTDQLLRPQDWFNYWTLNCRLASLHSLYFPWAKDDYLMEDKWNFLQHAKEMDLPVSPWLEDKEVVVKDSNEEGGLGIFFYRNATQGGHWIIQPRLYNGNEIASLLPEDAPLSTFRVMTGSRGGLIKPFSKVFPREKFRYSAKKNAEREEDEEESEEKDEARGGGGGGGDKDKESLKDQIHVFSCVFRAGRSGALTDHQSILFDVNIKTGEIRKGTTNSHWYQLGPLCPFQRHCKWTSDHNFLHHPDSGQQINGQIVDKIDEILELSRRAHHLLLPKVPMAGWDVAITDQGLLLLEVNLSCNFFRASFDVDTYLTMVEDYFSSVEVLKSHQSP